MIDSAAAVRNVLELIEIPGGSGDELRVAEYLSDRVQAAGVAAANITSYSAHKKSGQGRCGNLIVKLSGTQRGPRRLLAAHMDTVPLCVGSRPIQRDDWIVPRDPHTALGGDNRAGCAVLLTCLQTLLQNNLPHPPLTFVWMVQEEIGLRGARFVAVSKLGKPKLCFNWDGGAPDMAVVGATGDINMEITVAGIASHAGAHPEDGVSAAVIAAEAIRDLNENGWHGLVEKGRNRGTSNVGVVRGGDATNVVMPELHIRAEARSHSPAFRRRIVKEFQAAFERAARKIANAAGEHGSVQFEAEQKYESFRLPKSAACVQEALRAIRDAGGEPHTRISNGGLDANWLTAHGLPTVTLGCGQADIHTVKESLHVPSYLLACQIAARLAAPDAHFEPSASPKSATASN